MFTRKLYTEMLHWKAESNGRTALLIQGARRVGKSTIAEAFAKNEYKTYLLIDFSVAPPSLKNLFRDISDLDSFFSQLQVLTKTSLPPRKSAIIFDEVQMFPLARQAIKHLVKDRRYDYIETGSLVSIRKNIRDIVIPSEERKLNLNPLDFEEFLWATGDHATFPFLREAFAQGKTLPDSVHRKCMERFRLYMLVGGMPQAITVYLSSADFRKTDEMKREILALYMDDFRRIDSSGRASRIFSMIPAELNQNASRYQVSSVLPSRRSEDIQPLLMDMQDSMTILPAYHANDPSAGLSLHMDTRRFKLFLADTGLFITLAFMDKAFTENILYEKILLGKLNADLGYVYENIIAQVLHQSGHRLFYHTFPTGRGHRSYEVDFLLSSGSKISPIEVKSSGYKVHKSLDEFCKKYAGRIDAKILIYGKNRKAENNCLYIPFYMSPFL